jgi:hypothetical protein
MPTEIATILVLAQTVVGTGIPEFDHFAGHSGRTTFL